MIPRTITEFINANQKESTGFIKILRSGSMKGLLYVLGIVFVLYTLLTYIKDQLENHLLYSFSSDSKKETIKNRIENKVKKIVWIHGKSLNRIM